MSACATAPDRAPERASISSSLPAPHLIRAGTVADAALIGPVAFSLDSALPLFHARDRNVLASSLLLGQPDGRLHYRSRYALSPGDVLMADQLAQLSAPQRLGTQHIRHDLRVRLPAPAGAPLTLRHSREAEDRWSVGGNSEQRRQVTSLRWTPEPAQLDLQWAGTDAVPRAGELALHCGFTGTLRTPLRSSNPRRTHAVQLSGRDCEVATSDGYHASLGAHSFGLAYSSERPQRDNRLLLSAIDPEQGYLDRGPWQPSYELRWSQTRRRDIWSVTGQAALRRPGKLMAGIGAGSGDAVRTDADNHWITSATVTRRMPALSVSADWTHRADPYWFMPGIGEPTDRLGLNLDFSRWAAGITPSLAPDLVLSWHWNQVHAHEDAVSSDSTLRLRMSAMW